jgi:hypothetical protein
MAVTHKGDQEKIKKYLEYYNNRLTEMELVNRYCKRYLDNQKYYKCEYATLSGPIPDITIWDKKNDEITVIEAKLSQISEVIRQARFYIGQKPNIHLYRQLLQDDHGNKIKCDCVNDYHIKRQQAYTKGRPLVEYIWILLATNQKKFKNYNEKIINECGIGVIKYNEKEDKFYITHEARKQCNVDKYFQDLNFEMIKEINHKQCRERDIERNKIYLDTKNINGII